MKILSAPYSIRERFVERSGRSKLYILSHPVFWVVLAIKIATAMVFGAKALTEHYAPLVSYFTGAPLNNPYIWALGQQLDFPFPAAMLFVLAAAKFVLPFMAATYSIYLAILIADSFIFLVLARWLKDRQESVLWYYWCSPVLFAINYLAGSIDIIPIAFLFGFLYFLFKDRYWVAFTLLGFALATKTGLIILLPFIFVYIYKESYRLIRSLSYVSVSVGIYLVCNSLYLLQPAFAHVAFSGGQFSLTDFSVTIGGAVLYVVPLVYVGLVLGSIAFQRLNKDIFLMFLAFAQGSILLFTQPHSSWYVWILPFFIYFFIKNDRVERYPILLLQACYVLYFFVAPEVHFLSAVGILQTPVPALVVNMAFTLLQGALILNIILIYQFGIQRALKHKLLYKPYLIGIAGDSGSGKSTLVTLLAHIFGEHNTLEIAGDDMHKWERGDPRWSQVTHLNPIANKLHDDTHQALRLKQNESVVRKFYDHAIGRFTTPERIRPKKIVVLQGLHTLYLSGTRGLLDLKIFLSPQEDLRRQWKIERDSRERGSDPAQVLKQLDARAGDSEKYIHEQKQHADVIISLNRKNSNDVLELLLDASFDIDPFVTLLREKTDLSVVHEHGVGTQHLAIQGAVTAEALDDLAYELVPEIWEINRRGVYWKAGLNGVLQLFLAHIVFYKTKLEHAAA